MWQSTLSTELPWPGLELASSGNRAFSLRNEILSYELRAVENLFLIHEGVEGFNSISMTPQYNCVGFEVFVIFGFVAISAQFGLWLTICRAFFIL